MSAHTPGPWMAEVVKSNGGGWKAETQHVQVTANNGRMLIADYDTSYAEYPADEVNEANARLIAAAPDHALIGWAMCVGAGRWEPFQSGGSGEFCMNGLRHYTTLDEFGVPVMTSGMRAAIAAAKGQS